MTQHSVEEARRRLEAERYRALWDAARARLERTDLVISNRPIKVDVSGEARTAISGLVGLSPAGTAPLSIRLDRLDDDLRTGAAAIGLRDLLERIDGPLIDRRARRARRDTIVASSWESLADHPAVAAHPRLGAWLAGLRSSGSALRAAGSIDEVGGVVGRALDVLARLPADGAPLAVFAAGVTGDSHALDRSMVLGSIVASGLSSIEVADDHERVHSAELPWRDKWARVGVVCDEVSVSVLVLNLPLIGRPSGPISAAVSEHREAGIPLRLTLQQLRAEVLRVAPSVLVRSCENPSVVVQAAATLGVGAAPLVCTDGQPNGAVEELLRQASTSGARVAHHGDFDWGGIHITNHLIARHKVAPWRYSTHDYLAAVEVGRMELEASRRPVSASWDPDLVPAMRSEGRRVFEEQVLSDLMADLES